MSAMSRVPTHIAVPASQIDRDMDFNRFTGSEICAKRKFTRLSSPESRPRHKRNASPQNPALAKRAAPRSAVDFYDTFDAMNRLEQSPRREKVAFAASNSPSLGRRRAARRRPSTERVCAFVPAEYNEPSTLRKSSWPRDFLEEYNLQSLPVEDYVDPEEITVESEDTIDFEVGSGGQARIYRAIVNGKLVAVKVANDIGILQEYSYVRQFQHPDIVRPVAFSISRDSLRPANSPRDVSPRSASASSPRTDFTCLACYEYAENGDLHSYLEHNPHKRKDEPFMIRVFDTILSAIAHLNDCGYLHGDIKPENILVTGDLKVQLADFGMCQQISDNMVPQGTPSYMAPEIIANWAAPKEPHKFTSAADVFSFGVLMVRVLSGKYPFRRMTEKLRLKEQFTPEELHEIFEVPKQLMQSIEATSPKLAVIAKLCLRTNPDHRLSAENLRNIMSQLCSPSMPSPRLTVGSTSTMH